jgi:Mrp family chromosome partitioning ATPase
VLVAGAGAGNLKSAVALNLAAALAAGRHAVRLRDLDGASSRAARAPRGAAPRR